MPVTFPLTARRLPARAALACALVACAAQSFAARPAGALQPAKEKDKAGSLFAGRTGEAKEKLLKAAGGTEDTEKAVALGLAWLAKQQQQDGGWKFDQGKTEERAAATGMVVLAYLGAGHTHKAPKEKAKDDKNYAPVVGKGVAFLSKQCALNGASAGRLSTDAYSNAIGALALVEAYGMTGDAALKPYAQAAVNYIQKAQAKNGSWGYTPQTNGDTSITGWQLQVLFVAKNSKGLVVDDKVLKAAVGFLDTAAAGAKKAMYGYQDSAGAAPGTALTAIGLLSRYRHDGWNPKTPGLADGVTGLLKAAPDKNRLNTYHLYYAALVVRGFEGDEWQTWNEGKKAADDTRKGGMRDVLTGAQITKNGADRGSWDPDAGFIGSSCGRLGTTALCVLSLEVYYRYAPPYERPTDDK